MMWMVRAGRGAYLSEDFYKNNLVAIGCQAVGDMSKASTPEDLKEMVRRGYPEYKPGAFGISASQA